MKKFLKLFIIFAFVLLVAPVCSAKEYRVLVLPDNLQFESTNYYVYPDASVMFASEIIDYLNHSAKVKTVSMAEIRKAFRDNLRLSILAKKTLKEFKYNYNISFVDLKSIANTFNVDKVLVITSTTDIQNYFLRRTVWDFLNIPGASVIDPAYRLSTFAALVDVENEKVVWQNSYQKTLSAVENRMIAVNFAPASEQLERLKMYSSFLSPEIGKRVEAGILPAAVAVTAPSNVQPISNQVSAQILPPVEAVDVKMKPFVITKPRAKSNGAMVNDL